MRGWQPKDLLLDELDEALEVSQTSCLGAFVCRGYEVVDSVFVFLEEGVNVILVEDLRALGLGRNEVEKKASANPGIEWDPI